MGHVASPPGAALRGHEGGVPAQPRRVGRAVVTHVRSPTPARARPAPRPLVRRLSLPAAPRGRVYLEDWDTFYNEAEKMYMEHPVQVRRAGSRASAARGRRIRLTGCTIPSQTRYVMKYRHCDGKIVLKVTNDRTVTPHRARPPRVPAGRHRAGTRRGAPRRPAHIRRPPCRVWRSRAPLPWLDAAVP